MSASNSPNTRREASLSDLLSEALQAVTAARTGNAHLRQRALDVATRNRAFTEGRTGCWD
jgi:hypothetical protein